MIYFVTGGCKNGKSMFAQQRAKHLAEESGGNLYYFATMIPKGQEDLDRIQRHIEERKGWGYITVEVKDNFSNKVDELRLSSKDVILFDSLTAALENSFFTKDYQIDHEKVDFLMEDIQKLMKKNINLVFVSDNIYCDSHSYDLLTEEYRKNLAALDKLVAQMSDRVSEITFGHEIRFR